MINKGYCKLFTKSEDNNTIYINMYISNKIKIYWRQRNTEKDKKRRAKTYAQGQKMMQDLKINGCAICGYNNCNAALDFHHVNPKGKKFNVNLACVDYDINRVAKELNKCMLLCANCHREIHNKEE